MAEETKEALMSPPMYPEEQASCRACLDALLAQYEGNKNEMARALDYTRNAISWWFTKGYIGAQAALELEQRKGSPLKLEHMRPDMARRRAEMDRRLALVQRDEEDLAEHGETKDRVPLSRLERRHMIDRARKNRGDAAGDEAEDILG